MNTQAIIDLQSLSTGEIVFLGIMGMLVILSCIFTVWIIRGSLKGISDLNQTRMRAQFFGFLRRPPRR